MLKILIGCIDFNNYTGSELYFYELAKELVKLGCDVTVCSNLHGGDLSERAIKLGVKVCDILTPPGYKLGDGKWVITKNGKKELTKAGVLYKTSPVKYDVLCLSHQPVINSLLKLYPNTPTLSINHSEVIDLENPVIDKHIKKYIAIRPEIKDYMVRSFNIPENIINVVYNPVDPNRFKIYDKTDTSDNKRVLFVGSLHDLREPTINDLVIKTSSSNEELWIVGKNHGINIDKILRENKHVKYFNAEWNIEKFIAQCDVTAGILLGRTTIESWMCGKPSYIYDIDKYGVIKDITLHEPSVDLEKFKSDSVAKEIMDNLLSII